MTIVTAVDRSNRAPTIAKEGASLAAAFDEQLHIVNVLTQSEFVSLERTEVNSTGQALDMDEVRTVAKSIADDAGADLEISYEAVGLMGDPADRVIEYAEQEEAHYIVVGPRKRSPTGKALFGSTAQSVLLNSSCPVVATIDQ